MSKRRRKKEVFHDRQRARDATLKQIKQIEQTVDLNSREFIMIRQTLNRKLGVWYCPKVRTIDGYRVVPAKYKQKFVDKDMGGWRFAIWKVKEYLETKCHKDTNFPAYKITTFGKEKAYILKFQYQKYSVFYLVCKRLPLSNYCIIGR
jgi:hypothetical protein